MKNGMKEMNKKQTIYNVFIPSIIISLIGLFNTNDYGLYICGGFFFIAGTVACRLAKGGGIIFLFSHGGVGMGIMMSCLLSSVFQSDIFSDSPTNIYMYFVIIGLLLLAGTIFAIINNLNDKYNSNKFFSIIPISIYLLALFLAGLLPHILNFVMSI